MKRTTLLAGLALMLAVAGLTGCADDSNPLQGEWYGLAHFPRSDQWLDIGRFEINEKGRLGALEVGGFLVPGVNLGTAVIDQASNANLYTMGSPDADRDYLVISSDQTHLMWVRFNVTDPSVLIAALYRGSKPDVWPPTSDYNGEALAGDYTEIPIAIDERGVASFVGGEGSATVTASDNYNLALSGEVYLGTIDAQGVANAGAGSQQALHGNFTNNADFTIGETPYRVSLVGAPFTSAFVTSTCLSTCDVSGVDYSAYTFGLFIK